jgi:hypothetical protein
MLSIQACPMAVVIYLGSGFIRPSQERVVTDCHIAGVSISGGSSAHCHASTSPRRYDCDFAPGGQITRSKTVIKTVKVWLRIHQASLTKVMICIIMQLPTAWLPPSGCLARNRQALLSPRFLEQSRIIRVLLL